MPIDKYLTIGYYTVMETTRTNQENKMDTNEITSKNATVKQNGRMLTGVVFGGKTFKTGSLSSRGKFYSDMDGFEAEVSSVEPVNDSTGYTGCDLVTLK